MDGGGPHGSCVTFLSASLLRWSALGGTAAVAAGLAMLVFGGGCATRALVQQTGVRVEVPLRFTRVLATETHLVVEFDAYTDLSPRVAEYAQVGPVAQRWAAIPIKALYERDVHLKDQVRSGQPPLPADLAAAAVPVARREGDAFVPEGREPRFEVTVHGAPTHDNVVAIVRPVDGKSGGFNRDLLIRRPRAAWAYPVIAVAMPFALVWDGVTLPFTGTYLLLLVLFGT